MPSVTKEEAAQKIAAWAKKQSQPWKTAEVLDAAGCSAPTARAALQALIDDGTIERTGKGMATRYGLPGQVAATPPEADRPTRKPGRKPRAAKPMPTAPGVLPMPDLATLTTDTLKQFQVDVRVELQARLDRARAEVLSLESLVAPAPPRPQEAA